MARQLRVHPPGGIHHITARGVNRAPIFVDDVDRQHFLDLVGEACQRHRCRLLAYCLMDNHVHLTMQDLDGLLSRALKYVNGVYAQRFNQRHGRTGHLFEGRFWNSLLETDSYFVTAVEYVHRNPVAAGTVAAPADYTWSSYRAYAGLAKAPTILDMCQVLSLYNGDRTLLMASTERSERDEAKEERLREPWPKSILGSEDFVHRSIEAARATLATDQQQGACPAFRDIAGVVAAAYRVDVESLFVSKRGSRNEPRAVAIHLANTRTDWLAEDVALAFGLGAASAVSMITRRLAEAAKDSPGLAERLRCLEHRLGLIPVRFTNEL